VFYKITKKSFTLPMRDEGKLKSAFNFDFMLRERERWREGLFSGWLYGRVVD
jgi:hypothetical protein